MEIEISSVSAFILPDDSFGGEVCVAIADGITYDATDWIKRSNYYKNSNWKSILLLSKKIVFNRIYLLRKSRHCCLNSTAFLFN